MKTILTSISAIALSLSFSACQTAPKYGACPVTGATTTKTACCSTVKTASKSSKKACCAAKKKTAKAGGKSCCATKVSCSG